MSLKTRQVGDLVPITTADPAVWIKSFRSQPKSLPVNEKIKRVAKEFNQSIYVIALTFASRNYPVSRKFIEKSFRENRIK